MSLELDCYLIEVLRCSKKLWNFYEMINFYFNLRYRYGMNKVGGINIEFLSVVSIHCILRSGKFIATPIPFLAVKQSSNNHFYIYSRHILHVCHKKHSWWLVFLEIELRMKVIKDDYIIFKIWDFSCFEAVLRRNYMTSKIINL